MCPAIPLELHRELFKDFHKKFVQQCQWIFLRALLRVPPNVSLEVLPRIHLSVWPRISFKSFTGSFSSSSFGVPLWNSSRSVLWDLHLELQEFIQTFFQKYHRKFLWILEAVSTGILTGVPPDNPSGSSYANCFGNPSMRSCGRFYQKFIGSTSRKFHREFFRSGIVLYSCFGGLQENSRILVVVPSRVTPEVYLRIPPDVHEFFQKFLRKILR